MFPMARVLIVDNNNKVRQDLQDILGIDYDVKVVDGRGEALLSQAETDAQTFCPHVIVLDLRLRNEFRDEHSGLELSSKFMSAKCILYSAYLTRDVTRLVLRQYDNQYNIFDAIGKEQSPLLLLEAVQTAASFNCAYQSKLQIVWPEVWDSASVIRAFFGDPPSVPSDLADHVIYQLFRGHTSLILESLQSDPGLQPQGRLPRSVVLRAHPDGGNLILKLAPTPQIKREVEKYNEFIGDGKLQGDFCALLQREPIYFWGLGGVIYKFLGGTAYARLTVFTRFYQQTQTPETILVPLRHFFQVVWRSYYDSPADAPSKSLFDLYDAVLELRKRLADRQRFPKRGNSLEFEESGWRVSLPNPVLWVPANIQASEFSSLTTVVTHGDLYGENLFVDEQFCWAIDFERTGYGHIFRDFVELEMDIITRLLPTDGVTLPELHDLIVSLTAPHTLDAPLVVSEQLLANCAIQKAVGVIAGLRQLAIDITGVTDFGQYLWGLLLHGLFVGSLRSIGEDQRTNTMLLSALICDRLQTNA